METPLISKRQFNRIRKFLPVRNRKNLLDDRIVISAIIFIARHGLPWRQLPKSFGNWASIYSKFRRWSRAGIIKNIFTALAAKLPKRSVAMVDSTYIKAQRSASSMRGDGLPRELGRSRGGITTKVHLLCNEHGQPMDFMLTGGETPDIKIAPLLVARNRMKHLLADKAYDSDAFRNQLLKCHIKPCIPAKSNRKLPEKHDVAMYRKRHKIENMFCRLKDWKGIAFRANRCSHTFHSFVALALLVLFL